MKTLKNILYPAFALFAFATALLPPEWRQPKEACLTARLVLVPFPQATEWHELISSTLP